jgi:uroporphyrinogen-III decarboxylase
MNGRERLTRVFRGKVADRIPFAPVIRADTLQLYPPEIQKRGPIEFTKMIGGDLVYRSHPCKIENDAVKVVKRGEDEKYVYAEYQTKIGNLSIIHQKHELGGLHNRIVKWPIEKPSDYRVMEHILEHQVAKPDNEGVLKADEEVGDSGILMGFQTSSPVQNLIQEWMGLVQFYNHLMKYTADLENLMALMHEKNTEVYEVMAESPVEVQCIIENTDIGLVSPKIYEKYSMKHVKDFVDIMHRHGKIAIVHMCGKINGLLQLIKQTGLDGIDTLTPVPVGDIEYRRVYQLFGEKFVVYGALQATSWHLKYLTLQDIERNIDEFVKDVLDKPFIFLLGADGLPGVPIEKFKAIAKFVQKIHLQMRLLQ